MIQAEDCRYFFNSVQHAPPPAGFPGEWIDLAADPSAAHRLIRLGVSPRTDLPAVTVDDVELPLHVNLGLRTDVERALAMGSVSRIIAPAALRPYLIEAVERGMRRLAGDAAAHGYDGVAHPFAR